MLRPYLARIHLLLVRLGLQAFGDVQSKTFGGLYQVFFVCGGIASTSGWADAVAGNLS